MLDAGAAERSYRHVVLFSEIFSLVLENYVDPVEAETLLDGAYEGLLAGLDANGAYLSAQEVKEWKQGQLDATGGPGFTVLKAGRSLQVVAVEAGSPAEQAGVEVGDQIRNLEGRSVRDLSLSQAWRLLHGRPGTQLRVELRHPADGFRREDVTVARTAPRGPFYGLRIERGMALLDVRELPALPVEELVSALAPIREQGVSRLLVDVRNVADLDPRVAARFAGLFSSGTLLHLRDRSGRLIESLSSGRTDRAWPGSVAVLVNGATAGSAEALARLVQADLGGVVLGEPTYGLGAEPKLFELDDGSGLLISAALWETASGSRWNDDGVQPDFVIRGDGEDYSARAEDQLRRVLDWLEKQDAPAAAPREAA
jgi:carboxyl-terminal processing protease